MSVLTMCKSFSMAMVKLLIVEWWLVCICCSLIMLCLIFYRIWIRWVWNLQSMKFSENISLFQLNLWQEVPMIRSLKYGFAKQSKAFEEQSLTICLPRVRSEVRLSDIHFVMPGWYWQQTDAESDLTVVLAPVLSPRDDRPSGVASE